MGLARSTLELGMRLRGDEPRMPGELDHLDETLVGRQARNDEAGNRETLTIRIAHLVTVTMPLVNQLATMAFFPTWFELSKNIG